MKRPLLALLVLAAILAVAGPALAQCAMCQTVLKGSAEGRQIGERFNNAILVMLAAPYLVVGTVALALFRGWIREAALRALGRLRLPRVRLVHGTGRASR